MTAVIRAGCCHLKDILTKRLPAAFFSPKEDLKGPMVEFLKDKDNTLHDL